MDPELCDGRYDSLGQLRALFATVIYTTSVHPYGYTVHREHRAYWTGVLSFLSVSLLFFLKKKFSMTMTVQYAEEWLKVRPVHLCCHP